MVNRNDSMTRPGMSHGLTVQGLKAGLDYLLRTDHLKDRQFHDCTAEHAGEIVLAVGGFPPIGKIQEYNGTNSYFISQSDMLVKIYE